MGTSGRVERGLSRGGTASHAASHGGGTRSDVVEPVDGDHAQSGPRTTPNHAMDGFHRDF